jgi:hypothetical protein
MNVLHVCANTYETFYGRSGTTVQLKIRLCTHGEVQNIALFDPHDDVAMIIVLNFI